MNTKRKEILAVYEQGPEAVVTLVTTLYDIIAEQQRIIELQAARITELEERVKKLEEQLKKNSRNSSKPPSTDVFINEKPKTKSRRKKSGKKPGGQKDHPGTTLRMVDVPDEVIIHKVHKCSNCERSLEDIEVKDHEKRQVFDIPPIKLQVTEHRAEIKSCPHCGCKNKATFSEKVKQPTQYGLRLASLAVYLHDYQLLPYERSCELLADVCGCEISPATLARAEKTCFEKLEDFEQQIKNFLIESPVINCDETGMRIEGKRQWLHVASTNKMTCYYPHQKRGSDAMNAMGILPNFNGTVVHDFWKSYYKYDCDHSICNAHLLRELTSVSENDNQLWSKAMNILLIDVKKSVDQIRGMSGCMKPERIKEFEDWYGQIIHIGIEENPQLQAKSKKRGRTKQTTAKNLLDRFIGYKNDILRFMHDLKVPFENNLAERDVRMMKVQQKISGTFRSMQGALIFSRVRSYISTVKKNQIPVMDAIRNAIAGMPFIPTIV
ncbi:IS66-like element ISMbu5 family transposase [Methanococcoides burtonii]|uniref:Transposase n=1 Tax=Methanococcoides burtonii (strain DSM 6242 / NBRC 107633 / OCM 468 / ACE-M) TaxID=259564 RepID=Q12TS2_METBU|nr:IS66-like element ISMbu5 family transposase [Methanococcoides burtonii]ABE51619.1 transposase [Methanococcoides burtonii DSM 6242]ABE51706.1 transposase [Methanococcoides burtonii DSM 6242]ABE51859.1 transposase [Methanococcoides burtonii DSM 6242]ABE52043.1 transposase [Methanococcoides burtonii DSM 6242]ABE52090.1 transposase [Methanococcoides burtonii DSM 6242]